jgi:hypothetical protein
MGEESSERKEILPGITSSWRKHPPAEYFSEGNHKLMYEESTRGMVIPSSIENY